ncbi:MAG TPA: hypothetical protein VM938_10695 [Acidimicrobiales bacterium]|nr:hypothetical protein [Acidimicrobiales bacterium]
MSRVWWVVLGASWPIVFVALLRLWNAAKRLPFRSPVRPLFMTDVERASVGLRRMGFRLRWRGFVLGKHLGFSTR